MKEFKIPRRLLPDSFAIILISPGDEEVAKTILSFYYNMGHIYFEPAVYPSYGVVDPMMCYDVGDNQFEKSLPDKIFTIPELATKTGDDYVRIGLQANMYEEE